MQHAGRGGAGHGEVADRVADVADGVPPVRVVPEGVDGRGRGAVAVAGHERRRVRDAVVVRAGGGGAVEVAGLVRQPVGIGDRQHAVDPVHQAMPVRGGVGGHVGHRPVHDDRALGLAGEHVVLGGAGDGTFGEHGLELGDAGVDAAEEVLRGVRRGERGDRRRRVVDRHGGGRVPRDLHPVLLPGQRRLGTHAVEAALGGLTRTADADEHDVLAGEHRRHLGLGGGTGGGIGRHRDDRAVEGETCPYSGGDTTSTPTGEGLTLGGEGSVGAHHTKESGEAGQTGEAHSVFL
ncbi:hypothetical protein SDC9_63381 [bioreactor metagenome]|uniref:Uncharacterized protein n=1 Tax=bioreactor metagenome TaxID=1076179 RepID=A0A644XLM3_9ZZZZ